ncbi:MAG TPA: dihydrofolate reductase family protein [Candidatus Acidoferrum sp.]|nr:dihydrofolate reductase family protein [Candidatus Acidoferrum sp.]
MRKLIVLTFISLDSVMQAPGGPQEDTSGGFAFGGWTAGYFDGFMGKVMAEQMGHPFDLLLGRTTYDLFAAFWPHAGDDQEPVRSGINKAKKYVVSHRPLNSDWEGSALLEGDIVAAVQKLKAQDGPELQVHGSSQLVQTLLKNDLVDELWLKTFPVTLGGGKRLFGEGTMPAGFKLLDCQASPSGVIVASYARDGAIKVGSMV